MLQIIIPNVFSLIYCFIFYSFMNIKTDFQIYDKLPLYSGFYCNDSVNINLVVETSNRLT